MLEDKKVEIIRNKELVSEYLFERGLSSEIMDNPRYESILWKLSNIIRKMNLSSNRVQAIQFINSIVSIDSNSNIIMLEGEGPEGTMVSSKYMYDMKDEKLKRFRVESRPGGVVNVQTISVYNDDGIEESLGTEQNIENGKYFSKATRLKNRVDMIKIERMRQEGEHIEKLPDIYQQRIFWAALEDISPDADDIDPFGIMHFNILGTPEIYADVPLEVQKALENSQGEALPLQESERQKQLSDYKNNNDNYGRTKAFEKGLAKYLIVKDKTINEE